jgi:hypothetical protein
MGNTDFSFGNLTVGTGTGGLLFVQDPAVGNDVSQVVSIIPQLP